MENKNECQSLIQGLPVCAMSLRTNPAATDVRPGGHLRVLRPDEWFNAGQREKCRCDHPELEHTLSPLGVPVEVLFGSPEHHVCNPLKLPPNRVLKAARVELLAEAFFVHGPRFWHGGFEEMVVQHKAALEHVLRLTGARRDPERLELAQHRARVATARHQAWEVIGRHIR